MIIKIPFKTPNVNNLYWHRGNMKIMKKEAKDLRKEIEEIVISEVSRSYDLGKHIDKLKVIIEIHEDWYYKNGNVRKIDVANREKFLIDSIFLGLGIDDRHIFDNHLIKVQDTEEYALVKIEVLK